MAHEAPRTRAARVAAETALVRVVHHYGQRPEFVLLGGLMPEYLCSGSAFQHAGTTDVDVQMNLEIACGTVNVQRLEDALRNAEFEPDAEAVWRWSTDGGRCLSDREVRAPRGQRPDSCWRRPRRPGTGASRRIGTTSRSCFSTTTRVVPRKRWPPADVVD